MRLRALLVTAVLGTATAVVPAAVAEYPELCYPGVQGVGQRALVATDPAADGPLAALVARAGGRVGPRIQPFGVRHVELPSAADRDALLPALRAVDGVRWAEPDFALAAHKAANDPLARDQWAIGKIGLKKAWDVETGKSTVTVAVLDTGVAGNHPDLRGKVVGGIDVINGDDNADDDHGHGTHVAGTVAASANNRIGVVGVAWGTRILPVKVLAKTGGGTSCDVFVGMIQAVDAGATVLNMSLGAAQTCPAAFRVAAEYATYKKAVMVASSGNDALQGAPTSTPANCAGVIGVGATDAKDKPAIFSTSGAHVDVAAPGVQIMSTMINVKKKSYGYGMLSGTSMAAPHVAGLAALVLSKHPDWTPAQVSDALTQTADDRGARGRDDFYGHGRINAAKALAR